MMCNLLRIRSPILHAACLGAVALGAICSAPAQELDPVVNGEALVRLIPTANIAEFNARYGTTTLREIPTRNIYLVELAPGADPQQFKTDADADPDTVWVELNYYGQVPEARGRCFYTTDGADAQQYLNQPAWDQISLPAAAQQSTGDGMTIAIVDSGIDATHITLANVVLNTGWNFVDDNADTADVGDGIDNDGDGLIDEMTGHGTHVAGIVRMVAPDALLLPVKVLDSEGLSDNFLVAAGIFYAIDQNVDVINVSVGSTYNSEGVLDAVLEAQSRGIVVAAAGGNADTHLPGEYPALNTGVIGVASVNEADLKGWFSNWHEGFVVNAPGEQIFSTFPGNIYAAWDGTSMSTPMVAGVAALLLSRHPEWSLDQSRVSNVRTALMQSADPVDDLNPEYAGMLGAGRLNAAAALSETDAFQPAGPYPVGNAPAAVATVDLDNDGLVDLVVTNTLSGSISVLLHDTSNTYGPAVEYPTGFGPCDVAQGDFNHDGNEDIAVANEDSGSVSVLMNAGDGTLSPRIDYPVGSSPRAIVIGDLDGDDDDDIAVALSGADSVLILLNDGDGAFVGGGTFAVGSRPLGIALADLNDNDRFDLITVNRDDDSVSILLNNGDATFAAATHVGVGSNPRALTVADFDHDGDIDVATANHDSRDITLIWNDGAGTFGAPQVVSFDDGRKPVRLTSADLDCDGDLELIATSADTGVNAVSIFLSRGDGTFHQPVHYGVGANPIGVAAEDLDGDLDRDLVIVASDVNSVALLLNQTQAYCGATLPGDLDGDCLVGLTDLALLLASYGIVDGAVYGDGDLDKDGDVDLVDLAELLGAYGTACG